MNNVINWFEIPVADMDRAVAFYEPVMQVSLRRETMDCAELAVFPHQDPAPAARWPNLKVSRPRRRALLFICILIILPPRWSALPRRVGPVSSAR
ncbi:hypothetical protein KPZU09_35520 [Klebsiella pneumoniae]|uniref:Glyoxalase n=1 Tax=Klebsiella pneumoniae TaxID=573 RepID=A0A919LNW2_KLEPN|nr:hypothetical protein KPZU09_35520 [Klebsiella pneumoniae]VXZ88036.1 Predicted enzyme related to lactoylglutathione lyase [Klebsiella pneumoniae]